MPSERTYVIEVDGQLVGVEASALSPTDRLALNGLIRTVRTLFAEARAAEPPAAPRPEKIVPAPSASKY